MTLTSGARVRLPEPSLVYVVPSTPHLANSWPASEYQSQSTNCIMATKFLPSRALLEIITPFSSRLAGLTAPAGPTGKRILPSRAFGSIFAMSGR